MNIPSISGMVKIPEAINQFLVAHDTKGMVGARLGIIDVQTDGPRYQKVDIHNWPSSKALPNDVEGICAIPNRPNEYLMVESGFYHNEFGRLIRIRYPGSTISGAEYLGSFRPFDLPSNGNTPRHEELEGVAIVAHKRMTVLLLARRGGKEKKGDKKAKPGQLIWGTLSNIDTPNPKFTKSGTALLSHNAIGDRGAADLYLKHISPNTWQIFSVATADPGDNGPFRSAVYSAGTLKITPPHISFEPEDKNNKKIVHWDFEGLKVEAIAAPAELFEGQSGLSIATDDENYNGLWRPVQNSKETRSPSPLLFSVTANEGFSLK
jgi:hypothetical protein